MSRLIAAALIALSTATNANAIVIIGHGGKSSGSDYSRQTCKPIGRDEDGERLWRCREPQQRGKGEKPVMNCKYIARTHIKMVYCSDGTKITVE